MLGTNPKKRFVMLKNLSVLEHKVADKVFHFMCDPASDLGQVEEALYKFLGYVSSVKAAAQAAQAQQAAEAAPAPVEPPKE